MRRAVAITPSFVSFALAALAALASASEACAPRATPAPATAAGRADDDDERPPSDDGPTSPPATARGNQKVARFVTAKRLLRRIYAHAPASARRDVYCGCPFDGARIDLAACDYRVLGQPTRAARVEWEHVVPASVFGRTFTAWREGDDACVDPRGKAFRGRSCAERASPEYARIEADMHNLYPAVGEVNALRGDTWFGEVPGDARRLGGCHVELDREAFEPRPPIQGEIARAVLYMHDAYPDRVPLTDAERRTFAAWDDGDPPDAFELGREEAIAALEGSSNRFIRRWRAAAP